MEEQQSNNKFFSLYRLKWTVIYDLCFIGGAAVWIFINVNFLGSDVAIDFAPSVREGGRR